MHFTLLIESDDHRRTRAELRLADLGHASSRPGASERVARSTNSGSLRRRRASRS